MSQTAWVTLATNDGYAVGALVLAHSLKNVGTRHKIHVLYTDGVSESLRQQFNSVFDGQSLVNVLDSNDEENLSIIGRPDLGVTFTKLHCWRLTQYEKCVFLDADTLVLQNADELFDRPDFSAAPDIGWPDFFNSGVFVFVPSLETYRQLVHFGVEHGTFDGGDQGLLNQFYSNWRELDASHRLPFIYNVTAGLIYSYAAAIKRHGQDIKIVHFLGKQKPWHSIASGSHQHSHWSKWQEVYEQNVKEALPKHLTQLWYGSAPASQLHRHHHRERRISHREHHHSNQNLSPQPQKPHENRPPSPEQHPNPNTSTHEEPPSSVEETNLELKVEENRPESVNPDSTEMEDDDWETPKERSRSSSSASSCSVESELSAGTKEERHYADWERGAPDFAGRDSFANIMSHIEKSLTEP
ncbi:hypothetical protein M3Y98_01105800 [Aphelenchoides besseyi]|nr:hypothetical protein M3Y98_01105800 [Aphelenchoides besseyi]KAI6209268.1 hypothetical protein M3Y96_00203600 [Aphelenchoides besseyi]